MDKKLRPNGQKKRMHIILSLVLNAAACTMLILSKLYLLTLLCAIWLAVTGIMIYYYFTCYFRFTNDGVVQQEGRKQKVVPYKTVFQPLLLTSYRPMNTGKRSDRFADELRIVLCSKDIQLDLITASYTFYDDFMKDENAKSLLMDIPYTTELLDIWLKQSNSDLLVPKDLYEERKRAFSLIFRTADPIDNQYILLQDRR